MKFLILALSFFVWPLSARTQESSINHILTWSECIQLAQKNNLDLQIARNNLTAAEYAATGSRSSFYPHISAVLSGNQNRSNDVISQLYSAQINVTQNIFSGFQDLYKTQQSDINLKIARLNLQIAQAQLSFDLKQAYENLVYLQSYLQLAQDIVRRRQDNFQNVQLRFNSGRENKGSVLLSEAYSSQAVYEELQARQQLISAQEDLGRILGLSQSSELKVIDHIVTKTHIESLQEASFKEVALKTPDYQLAELQFKAADVDLSQTHSGFYPSLDLSGSYGKFDSVFFPESNPRWSLGLTLTIPLFDGFRDYSNVKSSAAKLASATKKVSSSGLQIKNKIRESYYNYIQAYQKNQVDLIFKKAAEVRADIARNKYNNGLMTFDDWDAVETDLIARQKSSLSSLRDSILSEARWEQIQGIGVIQ